MSKQSKSVEGIPLAEPTKLEIRQSPEAQAVEREISTPATVARLAARIERLRETVTAAASAAEAEARAALADTIEVGILADAPGRLEAIWQRHDAAIERMRADGDLNDEGRRRRAVAAAEARDEAIAAAFETYEGHAEALIKRASPPRPPAVTPEVAAAVQSAAALYPLQLPEDYLDGALDQLEAAVDPDEAPVVRELHTSIVAHAHVPLLKRRSAVPEGFAQAYRDTYAAALEVATEHLAARGAKHRAAVALADEFRGAWHTLDQTARASGRWDSFLANVAMGVGQ